MRRYLLVLLVMFMFCFTSCAFKPNDNTVEEQKINLSKLCRDKVEYIKKSFNDNRVEFVEKCTMESKSPFYISFISVKNHNIEYILTVNTLSSSIYSMYAIKKVTNSDGSMTQYIEGLLRSGHGYYVYENVCSKHRTANDPSDTVYSGIEIWDEVIYNVFLLYGKEMI